MNTHPCSKRVNTLDENADSATKTERFDGKMINYVTVYLSLLSKTESFVFAF